MKTVLRKIVFTAVVVASLAMPSGLQACATCFGKSDSAMAQGMNAGILTLLLVVGFVLFGAASFFVYIARRSAAHTRRLAAERPDLYSNS